MVIDQDKIAIELQMWGEPALDPNMYTLNTILAIKDCKVSIYQE
jgi:hypothetical protein